MFETGGNKIMKKLNVAVIGQGRSGRDIHGEYLLNKGKELYNVVAVVDALEIRRNRAKEEFGCDVYETYQELFNRKDIDLVINSTFSHMHPSVTIDLLNHGFNVIVEKPMARCRKECDEMIEAAKKNNVKLMVFQQARFASYFTKLKEIINSGVLGRIIQINVNYSNFGRRWDWQTSQRFYGGSLLNTAPHPLDQILELLGYEDVDYNFFSKFDMVNTYGDAEDYVKLIINMPGKPLIDLEVSSCDCYKEYMYKVQGSNGGLIINSNEFKCKYFDPEKASEHTLDLETLVGKNGHPDYCSEKLEWTEVSEKFEGGVFTEATADLYRNVYEHITEDKPLVVTPEQIRTEITLIEQIHAANPLELKY